jgi:ABC-2 type transport system permease protein
VGSLQSVFAVLIVTAWAEVERVRAYAIEIIRWPVYPVLYYATLLLAYQASGREAVDGVSVEGFLFVGTIGMVLWSSTIWASGYAIEMERTEGTINSLFLTPANRSAVVFGRGIGSFAIFITPTLVVLTTLAVLTGATFDVQSPVAVVLSFLALVFGALALGHALAGAFVLTRRANMWANFLQSPIFLLSGMVVPVSELPDWLSWFAAIFPLSAGMSALRDSLLAGAGLGDITAPLLRFSLSSLALLVIGSLLLRRVENVAKRSGQFDLD